MPPTPFLRIHPPGPIQLDVIDYARHAGDIRLARMCITIKVLDRITVLGMHTHPATALQHPCQPPDPCHITSCMYTTSFKSTRQYFQGFQMLKHPSVCMPMITPLVHIHSSVSISAAPEHSPCVHYVSTKLVAWFDQYSRSHSAHKHACSCCGYLVRAHTTCCPVHISIHGQSHTSASSCIRHNQSFHELVPGLELDHSSGFMHAHALSYRHHAHMHRHPVLNAVMLPYHERVQILTGKHTITRAQSASMYCNIMHHSLLFQHHDCTEHRPTDNTLDAGALQQYMHTHSQLSLAHKQLLPCIHSFIHTMHMHTLSSCSSTVMALSLAHYHSSYLLR
jgi:hypothetical protein